MPSNSPRPFERLSSALCARLGKSTASWLPNSPCTNPSIREKAIEGDEPVGHRSCRNGLVLNYSGIRQQRHGRDRPHAEERQPERQVLAHCVDPQAKRAGSGRRCSTGVMIPKGAAKARRHCSGYVAPAQHRPTMKVGSRRAEWPGDAAITAPAAETSGSITPGPRPIVNSVLFPAIL